MSEDPPEKTGLNMGDLKKLIQDTVADLLPKENKKDSDDNDAPVKEDGSIADRVRQEIENIRSREKADKESEDLKTQVAALAEASKEKPPVERRRVHRLMGWGENAD